jgi:hypothetical protein
MEAHNVVIFDMILLQLKSSQSQNSLYDIQKIHERVLLETGFRIRGHEIQQINSIVAKTTLGERAPTVSTFCSRSEIDHLTFHCPIYQNGENIWSLRWREALRASICVTAKEAEVVHSQLALKSDVVVIVHLTNYVPLSRLPINFAEKIDMQNRTEREFLSLYRDELRMFPNCKFAVENSYPKYANGYATTGPFHPKEIVGLGEFGIGTVLDMSHYQLYLNYLTAGTGNQCGDLDRAAFGDAPGWHQCIEMLSETLVQLHINNARGMAEEGEGLPLMEGEVDVVRVLEDVNAITRQQVRGTVELAEGHLFSGKLQLESVLWLIDRVPSGVFA